MKLLVFGVVLATILVLIRGESHFGIQNEGKMPLVRRTGNNIMRMDDAAKLTGNDGPSKGAKCVGGGGGGRPGPPGPPPTTSATTTAASG